MILWHNEHELSSPAGQGVTRITLQPLWLGMLRNSLGTHWLWSWRQVSASDSPGHLVWLPCQLHWAGFTSAPGKGRGALPAHSCLYTAKQYIHFWWIQALSLFHFFISTVKVEWTVTPTLHMHIASHSADPECKQLLTQHAGEHPGSHSTALHCSSTLFYRLATAA